MTNSMNGHVEAAWLVPARSSRLLFGPGCTSLLVAIASGPA